MAPFRKIGDSIPFAVVQEGRYRLFVERIPEYDEKTHSYIPSRDFSYRIRETGEIFRVNSDMDADEAYWKWKENEDNLPSIEQRVKQGKGREFSPDTCCILHQKNFNIDYTMTLNPFDRNCRKCTIDLINNVSLLDDESKGDVLDYLMEGFCDWL